MLIKFLIFIFSLLTSQIALSANVTSFNCITNNVIEGKAPTRIEFQVSDLGEKAAQFFISSSKQFAPVKMTPADSHLFLNENSTLKQKGARLLLKSNVAGCQITEMVLYKNSAYEKGYVSVKPFGVCGTMAIYSALTCEVR